MKNFLQKTKLFFINIYNFLNFNWVKIRNFWHNWLWQKIVLLVSSAVISFILLEIVSHFIGKTSIGAIVGVILFIYMLGSLVAIPVVIIQAISRKIAEKKQKLSEEQIKKDEEMAQAVIQLLKEWNHPPMQTDLILPKWEICLMGFSVAIYKERNLTKGLAYGGFRYRVKIAKGLSYNIGTINPHIEKIKVQYVADRWILYITNKRLIYKSDKKTENIKIDQILSIEMIPWGVMISKETGTVKAYHFLWEYKLFPVYMSALMNKEE